MSESRQLEALKMLMMGANVEESERDRILEEFKNSNAELQGKMSAQKDRQVCNVCHAKLYILRYYKLKQGSISLAERSIPVSS